MIVRLFVSNDKANVKKVVLRSDTIIGRAPECNLRIASPDVSRKHCSISLLNPGQVLVRDLGSSNGTFVNGARIDSQVDVPVPSGAVLEVGNVRFTVNYDAPAQADAAISTTEVPAVVATPRSDIGPSGDASGTTSEVISPGDSGEGSSAAETMPQDVAKTVQMPAAKRDTREETADERVDASESAIADEGEPGDDDTFALKETAEEAAEAVETTGDATVAMTVDDLDVPQPEPASAAVENPSPKKGWKSLFGLFGGRRTPTAGPESVVPTGESDETVAGIDETVRLENQIAEDEPAFDPNETLHMPSDEVADEVAGDAPEEEDTSLKNFLGQFPQE